MCDEGKKGEKGEIGSGIMQVWSRLPPAGAGPCSQ